MTQRIPGIVPLVLAMGLLAICDVAGAQSSRLFRIATGGAGGTYYPIGELIASAISDPGPSSCLENGDCGVRNLIAVAQTANGSVANVMAIAQGTIESGFAQSDIVSFAYHGSDPFEHTGPLNSLRVIANLYHESVHLVASRGRRIESVSDLRGLRVALDEPGSGTLIEARLILNAFGLSEDDIRPQYVKPSLAAKRMRVGRLDAFFIVAGYPAKAVADLVASEDASLVGIDGDPVLELLQTARFLNPDLIPVGVYPYTGETPTVGVGAQWVVSAEIDDDLVYAITAALWSRRTRKMLDAGHPRARSITLGNALSNIDVPLHPGAARYYREAGMID